MRNRDFILHDPGMDATGGGAPAESGNLDMGMDGGGAADGFSGDNGADQGQTEDDYADLAGDERVKAFIEKQYGHIPQEHRTPDGFKNLLGARDQVGTLQQQLQALQQKAQQGGQQGQQAQQEAAFHEAIITELEKDMGSALNPKQKRFFSGMLQRTFDRMNKHFEQTYFAPIRDAMVNQRLEAEYGSAQKLPGFAEHQDEIMNIVRQSEGKISFQTAYKAVMYDKKQQRAGGAIVPNGNGNGANGASGASGRPAAQRTSDGDRPSGAASSGQKMPKYKTPEASREGAAVALRSRGIRIAE